FGRLPNLDPYGRHLSFIEYYLIDIFLVVLSVIIFVAFVIYKMARSSCELINFCGHSNLIHGPRQRHSTVKRKMIVKEAERASYELIIEACIRNLKKK
ncbi:hypothetical protein TELCIR_18060, partial [Teladorsagia circumcincta]